MRTQLGLVVGGHLARRMGQVAGSRPVSACGFLLDLFGAAQAIWAVYCGPESSTRNSLFYGNDELYTNLFTQKAPMDSFKAGQSRSLRHTLPYTHQTSFHPRFWLPANLTGI